MCHFHTLLQLKRHQDNPEANEAVTIAEFEPDRVPFTFTAGSGDRYYEFANDRLDSNQYYGVFIVGVVYLSPGVGYLIFLNIFSPGVGYLIFLNIFLQG